MTAYEKKEHTAGADEMELVLPDETFCDEIGAFRQECLSHHSGLNGTGYLAQTEDPREWLQQVRLLADASTVPDGWMHTTQFLYIRKKDRRIVGMSQIRHFMNARFSVYGGNIGLCIRPSEQKKGYGSELLLATFSRAREAGVKRILYTCADYNTESRQLILNHGGVYESTVYDEKHGTNMERYWKDLAL